MTQNIQENTLRTALRWGFLLTVLSSLPLGAEFQRQPSSNEGLQAVIFDWAGTMQDYGSQAPVDAFQRVFSAEGVEISKAEARHPMGVAKREHIEKILKLPSFEGNAPVAERWNAVHGSYPTEIDVDRMYDSYLPAQIEALGAHSGLIPGAKETFRFSKSRGWLVGTTTGYVSPLQEIISAKAREEGYIPDAMVSSDMVPMGRPKPHMVQVLLNQFMVAPGRTVKVDDTLPGIDEGENAGTWTIFVYATGNEIGLNADELAALDPHERQARMELAAARGIGRAHYSIPSVKELPRYLAKIDQLVRQGYQPHDFNAQHPAPEPEGDILSHLPPPYEPLLFTPGPLTTSMAVKRAGLHDYGSRDETFIKLTSMVRRELAALVNAQNTHTVVPLQGSGTFAVEAMLGTFVAPEDKLLIVTNGAYGKRLVHIAECLGIEYSVLDQDEATPIQVDLVQQRLAEDSDLSAVAFVHSETSSGVLNPLSELAKVAKAHGCHVFVDAMSSFATVNIDLADSAVDALAASANKGLQGIPGFAFCIARPQLLARSKGNCPSFVLDLNSQWEKLEADGQWRFTPPVQAVVAAHVAIRELQNEGGIAARNRRYQKNMDLLRKRIEALGLKSLVRKEDQGPVIATFRAPTSPKFDFVDFYGRLRAKGFAIYPGKLTMEETFRVGVIGQIEEDDVLALCKEMEAVLLEMGVSES